MEQLVGKWNSDFKLWRGGGGGVKVLFNDCLLHIIPKKTALFNAEVRRNY